LGEVLRPAWRASPGFIAKQKAKDDPVTLEFLWKPEGGQFGGRPLTSASRRGIGRWAYVDFPGFFAAEQLAQTKRP